jgi:DNA invertase Pin-like site-specific DNA recombinase
VALAYNQAVFAGGAEQHASCRKYNSYLFAASTSCCVNGRFGNKSPIADFRWFSRCEKVLHYLFDWRYICAMLIGYARVSTNEQDTAAQAAALKAAGCERIYREKASGGRWNRPELHRLLDRLRKADVLVVWKLDRLSRSLRDVLTIMERLTEVKAGFRSLTEAIDTTTPAGRMMMQMVGTFAEFERAMLKERTKAGLDAAREEGRVGGRRPKLTAQQQLEIRKMVSKGRKTAADAARLFKVHPATVSRLLARAYAK